MNLASKGRQHLGVSTPGWVYILTNPAMPGLVKIGMTSRSPSQRVAELTRAAGVPSPFELAWSAPVSDCDHVEKAVHRMLADRRVNTGREFFRADLPLARSAVKAAAGSLAGRARLPIITRYRRPVRPRRSRRGHSPEGAVIVVAILTAAAIGLCKPVLPRWVPTSMAHVLVAIEGLAPAL